MLSEEVIDKVIERLVNRINKGNEYILKRIGESVKKIGTLSQSEAEELKVMIMYGGDYDKMVSRLSEITNINEKEIYEIFDEVAKKEYGYAKKFFDYKDMSYIPYEETALKNQVDALAKITADKYKNFSNTSLIGFNAFDETGNLIFKDLKETYIDIMDQAILNVGQGKQTFDEAMYDTLLQLAKSNLQTVEYESGATRSLDSTVRMNLKDGLMNLHNTIQEEVGREFKADGVEITVHENPAPDHADVQGRQFSIDKYDENGKLIKKGEFEKLQSTGHAKDYKGHEVDMRTYSKKGHMSFRPISMYNCYHTVYSIVLGVNDPQYSNKQLEEMKEESNSKVNFEGKDYTKYQCTQLQRRLESEIRKSKNEQILGKSSNNTELIQKSQERITKLTKKYRDLSKISELPEYMERMRVSGYRRVAVKKK